MAAGVCRSRLGRESLLRYDSKRLGITENRLYVLLHRVRKSIK